MTGVILARWPFLYRSILVHVDTKLCLHWDVMTAEAEKPRVPLVSHWYACLETAPIDQEALARAWGRLEALDRRPYPSVPSVGVAIR